MLLILLKDSFISYSKLVWKIRLAKWTLYTELVKSFLLTQIKDNIGWQHVKQLWQDSKGRQRNVHILIFSALEAGAGAGGTSDGNGQLVDATGNVKQVTFMSIFNGMITLFPISRNMTKSQLSQRRKLPRGRPPEWQVSLFKSLRVCRVAVITSSDTLENYSSCV